MFFLTVNKVETLKRDLSLSENLYKIENKKSTGFVTHGNILVMSLVSTFQPFNVSTLPTERWQFEYPLKK